MVGRNDGRLSGSVRNARINAVLAVCAMMYFQADENDRLFAKILQVSLR